MRPVGASEIDRAPGLGVAGVTADVSIDVAGDFVAVVEMHRPPNNYLDIALVSSLADALEALDRDDSCRAVVLCAEGRHFCAGMDHRGAAAPAAAEVAAPPRDLYREVERLFATKTPVVAAIQGAAVGGGLGLALWADFRVASQTARFSASFARLGLHHGFGLSVTLPPVVGQQRALDMLYTGRWVAAEEALRVGLCDRVAPPADLRGEAAALAGEIAQAAPLAVRAIRETMRGDLGGRVREAADREEPAREMLRGTEDAKEGIRAVLQRRPPQFKGR